MKNIVLAGVLSMLSAVGAVGIIAPTKATDNSLPVGTIIAWGGEIGSIPKNWTLCNGRVMSKTAYPDLFAALGTSWGTSGADKFNLPDLRGRFLRGDDAGTGRDPDAKKRKTSNPGGSATGVGSVQEDSLQNHMHDQTEHYHTFAGLAAYVDIADTGSGTSVWEGTKVYNTTSAKANILGAIKYNTKSRLNAGEETRPKNAAVNFIIKVK
jgi:microcystin-dependent protein